MKYSLKLILDNKERNLLLMSIFCFIFLCLVEIQFPMPTLLNGSIVGEILMASGTKTIISGLLIGVISAYFFYLLIDFIPRVRREEKTLYTLNMLVASILDAFDRTRIFGHETPISHVNLSVLDKSWIDNEINNTKNKKVNFLKLKFSMQTAHTRLDDFRHTLILAVNLSPERAIQWLIITDKVRLFAESYGEQPLVTKEQVCLIDKGEIDDPINIYEADLNLRFLEVLEESKEWLYPEK